MGKITLALGCKTLLLFFSATVALADGLDYSAAFGGRTLPLGAQVQGILGYGYRVWPAAGVENVQEPEDKAKGGPQDPTVTKEGFGYIRPSLTVATSVVTNRFDFQVDLFPVPFLGLAAGQSFSIRAKSSSSLNCDIVYCSGWIKRSYLSLLFGARYQQYGFASKLSLYYLSEARGDRLFVDDLSILRANPGSDLLVRGWWYLTYEVKENWQAAVWVGVDRMLESKDVAYYGYLLGRYSKGPWSYSVGLGFYSSSVENANPSILVSIKWVGKPSIGVL